MRIRRSASERNEDDDYRMEGLNNILVEEKLNSIANRKGQYDIQHMTYCQQERIE